MPTYDFRHKVTGEVHEKFMSISSREQYLIDNPDLETVMGAPKLVYEPGTNLKVSDGFREVISKIKGNHRVNNIKSY
jgi:hypothetical protein